MAFKIPLPVPRNQRPACHQLVSTDNTSLDLPNFRKKDFQDISLIGQGSFGKVFRGVKDGSSFVIKEMTDPHSCLADKRLFIKEAELLKVVQGHENMVQIRGFSTEDFAILMDYVSFSFSKVGVEHEPVSTLKTFLTTCDTIYDFKGFEHFQFHLASDICAGIEFLHSKNIVHRDLKPENVLVSNSHYINCCDAEIELWWSVRPVRVLLTDFGESRSTVIQTRSILNTATGRLFRGSPAYMAPEALADDGRKGSIEDLKKSDVWSLGMILFLIVNPDGQYPYASELKEMTLDDKIQGLRSLHTSRQLPKHLGKYRLQQEGIWKPLSNTYVMCSEFSITKRPSASAVLDEITNEYVKVQSLLVSQSTVTQIIDKDISFGWAKNNALQLMNNVVQQTNNACTFLAMMIADAVFNQTTMPVCLEEIATDVLLSFPLKVNHKRSDEQMYSLDEAYSLLRDAGDIGEYEFHLPTYSVEATNVAIAQTDLRMALHSLLLKNESTPFCAVYTCPPYTFLLCKPLTGTLTVVDTHIVSERLRGNNTAATIIPSQTESSVAALCQWIFRRMGVKNEIRHELVVMRPVFVSAGTDKSWNANSAAHSIEVAESLEKSSQSQSEVMNETTQIGASVISNRESRVSLGQSVNSSDAECRAPESSSKPVITMEHDSCEALEMSVSTVSSSNDYCNEDNDGAYELQQVKKACVSLGQSVNSSDAECRAPESSAKPVITVEHDSCEDLEMSVSPVYSSNDYCNGDNDGAFRLKQVKRNNNKYRKTEFSVDWWADCQCEVVSEIPSNINGLCKFAIECDVKDFMKVTKDGRPWATWISSSRKGFDGLRRIARCKGSLTCKSDSCLFQKQNGCPNNYHFQTRDGITCCFTCGSVPESVDCLAIKIWEYELLAKTATVYHDGTHSCTVKRTLKRASKQSIMKAIRSNPGVKPSRLINNEMVNLMVQEDFHWKDIESIAENYADMKQVQNIRDHLKREANPVGENFEALALFKKKCAEKDNCLIYMIGNRALNGEPSFVFKSSTHMARLALSMDRNGSDVLSTEYAHIDATHRRCRDFKSLTLWTYNPVMRKLMRLAVMEIEDENTDNLVFFWKILNKMLSEVSGQNNYLFNPCGFVADEHHANWKSIEKVYGLDAVKRTVSCEFHYKQSVQRHAKKLGQNYAADDFIVIADKMLMALSVTEFDAACSEMFTFLKQQSTLTDWFKWWFDRRTHIFRAFKPLNAPASNLAEVGHAKLSSVGRPYMSLIETAREDVAGAIRQEKEVQMFEEGLAKGGRGLENNQKRALKYRQEMKQAAAFAEEIGNESEHHVTFVPKTGQHRPPEAKKPKSKIACGQKGKDHKQKSDRGNSSKSELETNCIFHVTLFGQIKNLKKCYGCGKDFTTKHSKPPNDIILKTFCYRRYKNKSGLNAISSKRQAAYCHLSLDCARRIEPRMETSNIIVHEEVRGVILHVHKKLLLEFGIRL